MLRRKSDIDIVLNNWGCNGNYEWYISKPLPGPWLKDIFGRITDALAVLFGKAFAVEWK